MKINRRTAMKSLASALCLSQVRILNVAQPTAIPWEFFCLSSGSRTYSINAPFVQQGHQFATDARWLIRAESSDGPTGEERKLPDAEKCFQYFVSGEYTSFGDLSRGRKLLGRTICVHCQGVGIVGAACLRCDGEARHENPSYAKLCDCQGSGLGPGGKLCGECDGVGEIVGWRVLQVPGGSCFDMGRIVEIAKRLPGIEWRMPCKDEPTGLHRHGDPGWPLHFRSRELGVEGVLSSLRTECVEREERELRQKMSQGYSIAELAKETRCD